MPRRIATPGFGGFAGFNGPANPFIRMPDGRRMLVSDISDAGNAMSFGGSGDGGLPRAPIPAASPAPARARTGGDSSGVGLVNRNLFRQDNRANTEFWEQPRNSQNRPHQAISFEDASTRAASMNAGATIPQYQPTGSVFDEVPGYSYSVGEPTVQTPRMAGSSLDLDTAPSLFEDVGTNAFDQWWRVATDAPSVTVNAGDSGGSIWSGDETLSNFGNDVALGNDLNADLSSLGYGEDYPAAEALTPESPFNPIAEGSGIPVEPDPLNQDVGDLEYTTNPDDRRFLPGSEQTIEPEPVRSVAATGGANIRDFGGHSFNTPLTLGAYLNMPLEALRYGSDHPRIGIGTEAGPTYNSTLGTYDSFDSEGNLVRTPGPPPPGSAWDTGGRENAANPPSESESIPEPEAVSPEVRRGELVAELVTGAMSPRAYERATMGGVRSTGYRDTRGSSTFDPRAARLQLMASQSFGGSVNNPGQGDEGMSRRWGMIGKLNEAGEYEETGTIDPSFRSNIENYRGFVYGSQRSTARGRMAPPTPAGRGR